MEKGNYGETCVCVCVLSKRDPKVEVESGTCAVPAFSNNP